MDLSIKKVKESNLNFKGIKGAYSANNSPVFKFIAPPFDKKNEKVTLQFALLRQDETTKQYIPPKEKDFFEQDFNSDYPLELSQEEVKKYAKAFAYRYKITNKNGQVRYAVDGFKKIKLKDSSEMNLIEQNDNFVITPKTGPMYHSFIDADAILNSEGTLKDCDPDFVRNHFNKLGGSVKGLTYLLKNTDELKNFKYIITTPDIGDDPLSSHKYWPSNQYQCSNIEDFKEFIFELYKEGKGYVADGAFTSQGIHSPMVQHVLKWGEASPFYNMLKIDGPLNLGILPDKIYDKTVDPLDFIGVRIVNSPNIKGEYDKNKPTYVQFFDSRLSSNEQQNSNELIKAYDKNPDDHYDITSHQDSIIPYYFEINPDDKTRLNTFKNNKTLFLKDIEDLNDFLNFPNFSIVRKGEASGANFWDGNRDIIKMNLSNPTNSKANIEGYHDARNYLLGVAKFWSETIQSDLILKTALMSEAKKQSVALKNDISEEEYAKLADNLSSTRSFILEQNKSIDDYIIEFPLQSIETDSSLSAIFSEPQFNEEFLSHGTFDKIKTIVKETIDSSIPEAYKQNADYRTYVTKLYTPTIIKNILAGALRPEAINLDGTINKDEMKKVSSASLGAAQKSTVEEERHVVISKLRRGISAQNANKIKDKMQNELRKISLDDFKLADNIILKGKAGLNWRFDAAKDIGDLDSVKDKKADFSSIMDGSELYPGVIQFWKDFISNAAKYNPALYTIEEVTDFWSFADKPDMLNKNFDKKLDAWFQSLSKEEQDKHENKLPYVKEIEFINSTGGTTSSNYDAYFNNLSAFIGVDPEHGYDKNYDSGNIMNIKNNMEGFIANVQPNTAILSHMFPDNHDKPRIQHTLPLDMDLFTKGTMLKASDKQKEQAKALLQGRTDYIKISSKAVAVGLIMKKSIDELYANDPQKKEALTNSLINLVNGKANNSAEPNFKRADAFGATPYEKSTIDLFKNAGYENQEEITRFNYNLKRNSMHLQQSLWQMMNAIMGTPTMYYGTNFAQTGYETASKNVYVQNRNQGMHELKNQVGFNDFYNKMNAITGLYKENDLSAIRNGSPISLKYTSSVNDVHPGALLYFREQVQNYANKHGKSVDDVVKTIKEKMKKGQKEYESFLSKELNINSLNGNHEIIKKVLDNLNSNNPSGKEGIDMWPIYKYDEKGSRTISVITNNGIPRYKKSNEASADDFSRTYFVLSIPIKDKNDKCPLEEGIELRRKIYDKNKKEFIDENRKYIVRNGNIESEDRSPIRMIETVETFYVPKESNIKTQYMSYLYNMKS